MEANRLATELFLRAAVQPGILATNPEGDIWIELLCVISPITDEEREPLLGGARNLAERCRLVAEAAETVLGGIRPPPAHESEPTEAPPRYSCPECGSTEVELCFPVWVPANRLDDRDHWSIDIEAQPEDDGDKGWCGSCGNHVLVRKAVP